MTFMVSIGSCITTRNDVLRPIETEQIVTCLRNPDTAFADRIGRLRSIREMDRDAYRRLKVQLPYIVCGTFDPAIRKTENFASADSFIIDIDSVEEHGRDVDELFSTICSDSRVTLAFRSPSRDGIKAMLRFSEKCYDASLYSLFYKAFALSFGKQYGIESMVDMRVSDVCRACFLSTDPYAHYNPEAESVCLGDYLPQTDATAFFDFKHEIEKIEKQADKAAASVPRPVDPADAVMQRIKAVLHPKSAKPAKNDIYVPEAIESVKSGIKEQLESVGLCVYEMRNIQYGVKVMTKAGTKCAEINIFFGKRGYSVVESPKRGTCSELNSLTGKLIRQYLCPDTYYEEVV